jgi:hypothetical protein
MKKSSFLFLATIMYTVIFVQIGRAQISLTATLGTTSGSYSTLKGAFDKINDGTHRGVVTISVTGNTTETACAALNETGYGSASYTSVSISPSGARTISGDISTSLIYMKAADNITINGLNDGTNSLTLINTSTTENSDYGKVLNIEGDLSGGVVKTIEDFLITNCTIQGNSLTTPYLSIQGYYGCHDVTITNCDFGPYSTNYTSQVVYTYGESTTSPKITNLVFTGNKIHDYGNPNAYSNFGINIRYINGGSIANNKLYQTSSRIISYTGYEPYFYNLYLYGCKNLPVTGNVIGYANESGTGVTTLSFTGTLSYMHVYGIYNYKYTNAPINISQNEISGISIAFNHPQYSSTFDAIYLDGNTTVANADYTINDNKIGSLTVDGSIVLESNGGPLSFSGISSKYNGTHVTTAVISGNEIGGINTGTVNNPSNGGFSGIGFALYVSASSVVNITDNVIGSAVSPLIIGKSSTTNDLSIIGINMTGSNDNGKVPYTIRGNIVQNLVNYQNDDNSGYYTCGICDPQNGSLYYHRVVSHNVVRNIQSLGGVRGISFGNSGNYDVVIEYNEVYALSGGGEVTGISYPGNSGTLKNNFIYGIASTASNTYSSYGIYFFYNSVTPLNLTTNNIIVIGKDGSGNDIGGNLLYGIYDGYTTSSYYYNTVVLVGQATSGSYSSYSFYRSNTSNNSNSIIENNLFINQRTNNGCTGKHYAIAIGCNTNLTINYNDYYAPNTGGVLGKFNTTDKTTLALWKTATGQDANSISTNPSFPNAGGTSPCNYTPSAGLNGTAIGSITTDYYDILRSSPPSMGALEATYSIWTGTSSTDWNTAGNWSPATVPIETDNATIPGPPANQPVVNQDPETPAVCNNLSIAPGGVLTIAACKALTVNGTLTNNADTTGLVINSDETGTGSLINTTSNVNATIERYITGSTTVTETDLWHLVSSPVSDALSGVFLNDYLLSYNEPTDLFSYISETNVNLVPMQGYEVWAWVDGGKTDVFTGTLNTGSKSASLTLTDENGWNLLGNPYPCAIDFDASSGWTFGDAENTVYVWNTSGAYKGAYATHLRGGADVNGGSRFIPAEQGFFLHCTAGTTVSMTDEVKVHSTQGFYKNSSAEQTPNTMRLQASGNNYNTETVIMFNPDATVFYDSYDALYRKGAQNSPQLFSIITNDTNVCINSLPFAKKNMIVPVGFTGGVSGYYTLTANNIGSFDDIISLSLEDIKLNKTQDLRTNPVYNYTYDINDDPNRFILHFDNQSLGNRENTIFSSIQIYTYQQNLYIRASGDIGQTGIVTIYDLVGKEVYSAKLDCNQLNKFQPGINDGYYVVKAVSGTNVYTQRVVFRQ